MKNKMKTKWDILYCVWRMVYFLGSGNRQYAISNLYPPSSKNKSAILVLTAASVFLIAGCDLVPMHMRDQPKYETFEDSALFEDGMASQHPPANTVPRGEWGRQMLDQVFFTGMVDGDFVETIPIEVDREVLLRGRERYDIFCTPCHGRTGEGQGIIVRRGFQQPNSFHLESVRQQPDGYYYDVISNGFGAMYSYGSRVKPEDRWAIVAYIRALQFSRNVPLDDLPADIRQDIETQLEEVEESNESN